MDEDLSLAATPSTPGQPGTAMRVAGSRIRRRATISLVVVSVLGVVAFTPYVGLRWTTRRSVLGVDDLVRRNEAQRHVALVLGAGLLANGTPSFVLRARVETASELYQRGLVVKLVMSGDNSTTSHDEVTAMKNYATTLGVKADDVVLDYAGFRTLDSCVRIRKVFGQDRIFVVSQRFHLARAVHLCRWAGVDTIGVIAHDPRGRGGRMQSTIREVPASAAAWLEAHVLHRDPKFLGDKIDVDNPPPDALEQPR
jgi:vancomycin permeability regulator SanA